MLSKYFKVQCKNCTSTQPVESSMNFVQEGKIGAGRNGNLFIIGHEKIGPEKIARKIFRILIIQNSQNVW